MENELNPNIISLEHPSVKKVMETARELLKTDDNFQIDILFKLMKKRNILSDKDFFSAIVSLIDNKIFTEATKFSKFDLLMNKNRVRIYRVIKNNPGLHFTTIKEKSMPGEDNDSWIEFIWHLSLLMEYEFISKIEVENLTIFIPADISELSGIAYYYLRNKIKHKIIKFLINYGPILVQQIPSKLLESKEIVFDHMKSLYEANIIQVKYNDSGDNFAVINPTIKQNLTKILKQLE